MNFDILLNRLSPDHQQDIRRLFRRKRHPAGDAEQLLRDWVRISEVAHQYALVSYTRSSSLAILTSPSVRKRRDRQLRAGIKTAKDAVTAIRIVIKTYGQHTLYSENFSSVEHWGNSATEQLLKLAHRLEQIRRAAESWERPRPARGALRWLTENSLLDILAAYFRHKQWPLSTTPTGLVAELACLLLPNNRTAINRARLKRLAATTIDYAALEQSAPREVKRARP